MRIAGMGIEVKAPAQGRSISTRGRVRAGNRRGFVDRPERRGYGTAQMSSPTGSARTQRAAVLAIGDEVLRGEVANGNSTFLSERLFEIGFDVGEHVVVSDDPTSIRSALVRLRAEYDV